MDDMFARIDAKFERIFKKCDEIRDNLGAQRRYNFNTSLLVIALWGVGLPLVFLVSILYVARRGMP